MSNYATKLTAEPERLAVLTPREVEVLALASNGSTNAEIATRMRLSVHAIKFHLGSIFRKLSVTNRTEAAAFYLSATSSTRRTDWGDA